jgi:hypothetical protein
MSGSRNSCAIACWLSAVVALGACSRTESIATLDAAAPVASVVDLGGPVAAASAPDANVEDGGDSALALRAAYATAAPLAGKSVGHTSVVFKLKLEGGLDAAYKPRSTRGGHRYRGEVAAYRLARSLSLENVPYATIRTFDFAALERAAGRETIFVEVVKEPVTDAGDAALVRGALMPWIKGLEFLPLEKDEEIAKWRAWLKVGGAIPDDERAMAAQISTMLAFDYVTGNWDRWSGGNVGYDRKKSELLFIDNDGAFFDPLPAKEVKRSVDFFDGVERFSRAFVTALRAVDLAKAFGEEVPGEPLLTARQVAQADARRKKALAAIDAKIAKLGESNVLAFE